MVSAKEFCSDAYQLRGELNEVPHIKDAGVERLAEAGIFSTYMLLSVYLQVERDVEVLAEFLKGKVADGHSKRAAEAIARRVDSVGIKIAVKLPEKDRDGKPISSKLTDVTVQELLARPFDNEIRQMFPGVGFGRPGDKAENDSLRSLRERAGIDTTNKLYAAMLRCLASPTPSSDELLTLREQFGEWGVAGGYKTTVIEAMRQRLDTGIDNTRRTPLETIADPPEAPEPPRTDEGMPRRRSRIAKPKPEEPIAMGDLRGSKLEAEPRRKGGFGRVAAVAVMLAAGFAYRALMASCEPKIGVLLLDDGQGDWL
uniref:Uncharacterized protein n=1 Tax=Prymnesium polylepis TaxID=72548 RepID=A0A6T8DKE7_9EUKA|mmetsp:Transcript_7218/g.17100  ORF Transcript_7218/g.17100 Transcript_7218/m.17100 type:complete len:313 (+) Transcript_7218:46-984(+)